MIAAKNRTLDIASRYVLNPAQSHSLQLSYDVSRKYLAPLIVDTTHEMLQQIKHVDRPDVAVFVERDGGASAAAAQGLDPAFFDSRCRVFPLTRLMAEIAVRDLELQGRSFPEIDAFRFRWATREVPKEDIPGSHELLRQFLLDNKVPVDRASSVVLVDTAMKGTVQTLLSAAFPNVIWRGKYVVASIHPKDPAPHLKQGFALDLRNSTGRALSGQPERSTIFAHGLALSLLEDTLHGPLGPVIRFTSEGLLQHAGRSDPFTTTLPNPDVEIGEFGDPLLREAAKIAMRRAVYDEAQSVRKSKSRGEPWRPEILGRVELLKDQAMIWVGGEGELAPDFSAVMHAFVGRTADIRTRIPNELSDVRPSRYLPIVSL